ncbi:MAG: hypothetical protein IT381_15580 [Deltaproteobacteria bacterium]|nr:hypothetical protein [Deltaproteobacteria bacterium]
MRVSIRTTAGRDIGYGHLRRCRTLADALEKHAHAEVTFLVAGRAPVGFVGDVQSVSAEGLHDLTRREADLMVIDDYAIAEDEIAILRARVSATIAVIDDLAQRRLAAADVVINPSAGIAEQAYGARTRLVGPAYALLRAPFIDLPARRVNAGVARVLVTLGGADPRDETAGVLGVVLDAIPDAAIDVLLGPLFGAANVTAIEEIAHLHPRVSLHRTADVADLMLAADLAVAAGGQTVFELAATGLPALALAVAENQRNNIASLSALGTLSETTRASLAADVGALASDEARRRSMAAAGQRLVDGHGAERVAERLVRARRDRST